MQFHSDEERLTLALELLQDDMNNIRVELFKKANGHQQEVEDNPEKVHLFLKKKL